MARPLSVSLVTSALDADGIATSQTPAAGGAQSLTLDGALVSGGVATFSAAQTVTITSAGNDTGRTFTVTGTNADGAAETEAITGASGGAASSTKFFKTVSSIVVDANTAGAVTAGITAVGVSKWIKLDYHKTIFNVGIGVAVSGTVNYTVQHAFTDPEAGANVPVAFNHADLASQTATADGNYAFPVRAVRIKHNSGDGTSTLVLIQAGI